MCVCVCVPVYVERLCISACTPVAGFFFFSLLLLRLEKENVLYLFIENRGRTNDETFTVPAISYTQEQGLKNTWIQTLAITAKGVMHNLAIGRNCTFLFGACVFLVVS